MEPKHTPVLMEEVLGALDVAPRDTVIDATLGGAGHFARLFGALGSDGIIVGIDADTEAVARARAVVSADERARRPVAHLICDNFRNLARILDRLEIATFNKALFDLGWSGYQIASPRGFSFQHDEPLLMTYGEGAPAAAEIINSASEYELTTILREFGEERFARPIARSIIRARGKARIIGTAQLVEAVLAATPARYQHTKIHPATKTFQAFRIAANDELGALREGLAAALARCAPSGVVAVITFHSIEDRIVKEAFRAASLEGQGTTLAKPLAPRAKEIAANRRARSAKLRVFTKHSRITMPVAEFADPAYA